MVCVLAHALLLAHLLATDLCAASRNPHWVAIVANKTGARSILASTPGCERWSLEQLMATPPIAGPTPPSTLPQSAAAFCRDVSVSEAFPVFSNGHGLTHWVSSGHNRSLADVVAAMDECQVGAHVVFAL